MTPQRYRSMKRIFHLALEKAPSQRTLFLREACREDAALRHEVERLLAYHDQATVLPLVAQRFVEQATTGFKSPMVGSMVGQYRILEVLGAGSMGVVYRAEQSSPRREVALKVINPGIATPLLLRRFEYETQVLGLLQHPGIAQIYEAGTFDIGAGSQPYFAMELIRGAMPLTDYAQRHNLKVFERLQIMVKVCSIVQHAHQKGVIHRDLKPANILMTEEGQPRILDFGVARATDAELLATTLHTIDGQLIGTVPYMSPEQAGGEHDTLDVRSDVYALGVICYELLADRLPYELNGKRMYDALRTIREDSAIPLSSLDRAFQGDVDTIVAKALEKDKQRRYQSALELASDIDRHLTDQPIIARQPSTWYQLRRFSRRHRAVVGGTAAVFLALLLGLIGTAYGLVQAIDARDREADQRRVAEQREHEAEQSRNEAIAARDREAEQRRLAEQREREAAEARAEAIVARNESEQRLRDLQLVADFHTAQLGGINVEQMGRQIHDALLAEMRHAMEKIGNDAVSVRDREAEFHEILAEVNVTNVARQVLDAAILEHALIAMREQFPDQPLIRAQLLHTAAVTFRRLGITDRAEEPLIQALEIRRAELGDAHPDTLGSINSLGVLMSATGRMNEAKALYREALELRRQTLGPNHPDVINSLSNLAAVSFRMGKLDQAERCYREALEINHHNSEEGQEGVILRRGLAMTLNQLGRTEEAEQYYREALAIGRRVLGNDHRMTLNALSSMGVMLRTQEKYAEAESYFREALRGYQRTLGDDYHGTLVTLHNLGTVLRAQEMFEESESCLRDALGRHRRVLGDDHPDTVIVINSLGALLRDRGRLHEAEALAAEAVRRGRRVLPAGHWRMVTFLVDHGETLLHLKRFREAEKRLLQAYEKALASLGDAHVLTERVIGQLVELYEQWDDAEPDQGYATEGGRWNGQLEDVTQRAKDTG